MWYAGETANFLLIKQLPKLTIDKWIVAKNYRRPSQQMTVDNR